MSKTISIRKHMPFINYDVISWKLNRGHRDSSEIELIASVNLHKVLYPMGTDSYFSLFPCQLFFDIPPADRTTAVLISYPLYTIDSIAYNIPNGYEIKSSPLIPVW